MNDANTIRDALMWLADEMEHAGYVYVRKDRIVPAAAALDRLEAQKANARAEAAEAREHAFRDAERLQARVTVLEAALRGLIEDDDLPYYGDKCSCSMCQRVREARAALAKADTDE